MAVFEIALYQYNKYIVSFDSDISILTTSSILSMTKAHKQTRTDKHIQKTSSESRV